MRQVGNTDSAALLLARDRDGNEPAVALLKGGAEVALGALDRRDGNRVDVAAIHRRIDREEGQAHDFTLSPAGS